MINTKDGERIRELVELLNRAGYAYYVKNEEIMPNVEYDRLYDELAQLEKETGYVLASSPTQNVGYEAQEELQKVAHESPMLSLDKTKSREELAAWLNGRRGVLSWKLDGLTIVVTYEGGRMVQALTRGNGEIGELVTANARTFENLPVQIPFAGRLVIRGEAIIRYPDFESVNRDLEEESIAQGKEFVAYKNPRNLCSGSVRQLDPAVTSRRHVRFYPFFLVEAMEDGVPVDFKNSRMEQFAFLERLGFEPVYHRLTDEAAISGDIAWFEETIPGFDLPSDGLVLLLEDIAYGESLGSTAKFPRNAIAFKWADEMAETTLLDVEWSPSRTGLINPVAVFEPVELEGTTVQRASVHNVSIVRALKLGIGDRLKVYKANMIIPQIAENLTGSGTLPIPEACPVCGGPTQIRREVDSEVLFCTNPDCPAKRLKSFVLFVSRPAMNIDGLSEATLEKLVLAGFVREFADIYHLADHAEAISAMEGLGARSVENLLASIERSRDTTLRRVLTALGIPGIGSAVAGLIAGHFRQDPVSAMGADEETLSEIDGVGAVLASGFAAYFADPGNRERAERLLACLRLEEPKEEGEPSTPVAGKTFVITGSLNHFANRDELKERIESLGGKVSGSVSKKTAYLINNDLASNSGKNKKAKELGIPIISEEDFLALTEDGSSGSQPATNN